MGLGIFNNRAEPWKLVSREGGLVTGQRHFAAARNPWVDVRMRNGGTCHVHRFLSLVARTNTSMYITLIRNIENV